MKSLIPFLLFTFLFTTPAFTQEQQGPQPLELTFKLKARFAEDERENGPIWPEEPNAIVEDREGNLYSTTPGGGEYGHGTVFRVTPRGETQVIHSFNGTDGSSPRSGLAKGPGGVLFYGTTYGGGELNTGTIFTVSPGNKGVRTEASFKNGKLPPLPPPEKYTKQQIMNSWPSYPQTGLVLADGRMYGVTTYTHNQKRGMIYRLDGGQEPVFALYYFGDKQGGVYPNALTLGQDGMLYGTTYTGNTDETIHGTIYKTAPGSRNIQTVHVFNAADGSGPVSLMSASDGNLYGTTAAGGYSRNRGYGVLYKFDPRTKKLDVLHKFDMRNGVLPSAQVVEGADGYIYGAAVDSYSAKGPKSGLLYRIDKSGKDYKVIHWFDGKRDGENPTSDMLKRANGDMCGLAHAGGPMRRGALYCLEQCAGLHNASDAEPNKRSCCILGTDAQDPAKIERHYYARTGEGLTGWAADGVNLRGARAGFLYTLNAGFVDLGHVRDNADMTKFIFDGLNTGHMCMNLYDGSVLVTREPYGQEAMLELAGAIAYAEGIAHELSTWRVDGMGMDNSSFSPEDIPSNIIGIEAAKRAIKASNYDTAPAVFNAAMDRELTSSQGILQELVPVSQANTERLYDYVFNTRQWQINPWTEIIQLQHRNFSTVPWRLKINDIKPTTYYPPAWLKDVAFTSLYKDFDYRVRRGVITGTGIRNNLSQNDFQKIITQIQKEYTSVQGQEHWDRP
ncbi:MAG: DUF4056 domain-containing protein [Candidatus Omnitrophota bacterium]